MNYLIFNTINKNEKENNILQVKQWKKITIQESKTSSATQFKPFLNKADILQRHYCFQQSLDTQAILYFEKRQFAYIHIKNKYTYCFQYYETLFVFCFSLLL
jgi:hypothetical protein